jgi:hypothetical protein
MDTQRLDSTLRKLAGHLVIETREQQREFNRLYDALSEASPDESSLDPETQFSIHRADLFAPERISAPRRDALGELASRLDETTDAPMQRVFLREVPIRDSLLTASVPEWAAGARVGQSIGPFENSDGRKFWFDFYPIVRLTALHVQGIAKPVLLFKSETRRFGHFGVEPPREYQIEAGSVWVLGSVLAAGAPPGAYVGLRVDGGRLVVNTRPQIQDGILTVSAATTVTVELDLSTGAAAGPAQQTVYGIDAKNSTVELPRRLAFHFSSGTRTIDGIGTARWELYGQQLAFQWEAKPTFDAALKRIVFPFRPSQPRIEVLRCDSEFHTIDGAATIQRAGWALPLATIDITQPPEAQGTGAMLAQVGEGITDRWANLDSPPFRLAHPTFLVSPGQILISDPTGGGPPVRQSFGLWQDALNTFGSTVDIDFSAPAKYVYTSSATGVEVFTAFANADFRLDRPVQADGQPPRVRSVHSLLTIAVSDTGRVIYLFDDNLLQDSASSAAQPMALAMTNALFKVSQANGCLLFGSLADDYGTVHNGFLFLTFGLYAYLPTLPDPYAANLGVLRGQIQGQGRLAATARTAFAAWLVTRVRWQPPDEDGDNDVEVSFHFAPLTDQFGGISFADDEADEQPAAAPGGDQPAEAKPALNSLVANALAAHIHSVDIRQRGKPQPTVGPRVHDAVAQDAASDSATQTADALGARDPQLPDYGQQWDDATRPFSQNVFALLDVSTNADLMGVSFAILGGRGTTRTTVVPAANATSSEFPLQVKGMDVVSAGRNVRAFTVPQISWEPVVNLTCPHIDGDPQWGPNYYPDDGGPTQIINNSADTVALAPLPVTAHLLRGFEADPESFAALALMTLPFGMKSAAYLSDRYDGTKSGRGTELSLNSERFGPNVTGGLQLQVNAGEAFIPGESDMFFGSTVQLNNVLDYGGQSDGASTLGRSVTIIYNNEFFHHTDFLSKRGVPLERIDLSGYGASVFSNWLNPKAAFAETSQAKFDVFVGRCAHEVIQVKSVIYPWGIHVVRTITLLRVGSGYVYRTDSGWKAESNGEFDFRYFVNVRNGQVHKEEHASPFDIHPGVIRGLFNVQNIVETTEIDRVKGIMTSKMIVDDKDGLYVENPDASDNLGYELQPVYFDADVDVENAVAGFTSKKIRGVDRKLVSSKKIVGYVQIAPLAALVVAQLGSIGGSIDCVADLAGSGQKIRLNRFDFNNSFGANGNDRIFAVAGRGNVLLPKDGAWSMVKHERMSGSVTPVPANLSVPVIRIGHLDAPIADKLVRIADPSELLRAPGDDTLNYGFLQSTDTQKALFLTPAFQHGLDKLFSKTAPLFVDAFRIVNSKAVFPNIGNAENDIGDAISLAQKGTEFAKGALQDGASKVWQLMDVTSAAENAAEAGYKLLKQLPDFDLPSREFELIDLGDGNFRIYIEYKHTDAKKGRLDFDIDSAAANIADTWKSRMANVALVVDLAGIDRLMTIRGHWDSRKGTEAAYPEPELIFSEKLQPVIDILQILEQLQGEDYAGAVASGLKLAMSNKAGSWEYKFQASKEIPVLRFPVPDELYNNPNTPFKLDAGLKLGAYFNAALQVTGDGANLPMPSAGGSLGFFGRVSVMCVSLSAATVYAIGQLNLDIAADTKLGPSLRMKFGFGAQIVVGLPVVGNVSVMYVVGVEIFAAKGNVEVTAFLLYQGHAELLGGLVGITIRIEAQGTVSRKQIGSGPQERTDLACQVTFGLDISIAWVIDINFETSWSEQRQIA